MTAFGEIPMPRFFFHVHSAKGVTRDEVGQLLSNIDTAREEASKAVRELTGDVASTVARESMLIEVTDEAGKTIFNLPLPAEASSRIPKSDDPLDENDLA